MKLLTKEIIARLPEYGATEDIQLEDKIVICKFFIPWNNWKWFVFEGTKREDGDYLFFGIVHGHEKECGDFVLSELQSIKGHFGLKVERDTSVFNIPYRLCR